MNTKQSIVLILILIISSVCTVEANIFPSQVCIKDYCFDVEVAYTPQARSKGLQNRKSLERNKGMLFIFQSSQIHSFWMKDTLIALDIIWINDNNQIASIIPNIPPCTTEQCPVYTPDYKSHSVLEINAGLAAELDFNVGDKLKYKY